MLYVNTTHALIIWTSRKLRSYFINHHTCWLGIYPEEFHIIYLTAHQAFKDGKLLIQLKTIQQHTWFMCIRWQLWGASFEGSNNSCAAKKWLLHKAKHGPLSPIKYSTCSAGSSQNHRQFNKRFYIVLWLKGYTFFRAYACSFLKLIWDMKKSQTRKSVNSKIALLLRAALLAKTTISLTGRFSKPFTKKGLKTFPTSQNPLVL